MIVGIGSDLVGIDRFERILSRHGRRLSERILGVDELTVWREGRLNPTLRSAWLAKRFAVKEAAAKALGTGIRGAVGLRDIQTVHDEWGRPELRLTGGALARFEHVGARRAWLTVSDEGGHALAFVVLER